MELNILVTSIGSFSADCVINSLRLFCSGRILGCDIYPLQWHAVSAKFDYVYKAPLVNEEDKYLRFIKELCIKESIKTIIPLTDIEVDFFNNHRDFFEKNNIVVTIANHNFLNVVRNKHNLFQFTKTCNSLVPINSYLFQELTGLEKYPLIAKPKDGRSSEGIYYLERFSDLKIGHNNEKYFFQEVVPGSVCTVDYVRSSLTKDSYFIPRKELLRTANGAGMTIETFYSDYIGEITNEIGDKLDVNGCINLEFILNGDKYYLIDINPRFSAGVGFSKLAGYDFVKSHILCFMNQNIEKADAPFKKMIAQKVMTEVINLDWSNYE